jgi:ATP-dependent helicase/nuclease subunit A
MSDRVPNEELLLEPEEPESDRPSPDRSIGSDSPEPGGSLAADPSSPDRPQPSDSDHGPPPRARESGGGIGVDRAMVGPVQPPRELVLASAGTGKTFWITSRLIALLAYGAEPDHVLASTFTRKAAGEILHRTLDRLAEAALDEGKAAELAGHATIHGAPPLPADRRFWGELLEQVVRRLHRLNVGTLDAFFVRAARAFEHDLRMPAGWRIAEESAARRLRSRVLQDVVGSMGKGEMTELLRLVNRGEARRSVHLHLLGLIDELVAIEHELDPDVEGHWEAFVCGVTAPDREEREWLAARLERFPLPKNLRGAANGTWKKVVYDLTAAVRGADWLGVISNGLCKKVLGEESKYSGHPLDDARPLLESALDAARRGLRQRLADQVSALGRLARRFEAALSDAQSAEGLYRFDDLTRLLSGDDPLGNRSDLYYRLDARTHHILLDEFQDTSLAQWEALSPIVDEVLSDKDRAGVIVADPKQSIYGWRGAEPRLVRYVGSHYGLRQVSLHRSYRSSQTVLDLVNDVFGDLGRLTVLEKEESCRQAAEAWALDFTTHETVMAGRPGFVQIEAGPRDPGQGSQRPLLCHRAAERVAEIHRAAPGASIGVLTRTNGTVARMILELRRLGLHPSEEGGNPLTDSAACEAVLALIRLADHPGDTIARYHVARSPLGGVLGYTDHMDAGAAADLARRLRRELLAEGYGARLNRLARDLAPLCDQRERRRLMQLVELGYRHDDHGGPRPEEFVSLAEMERVEDPVRARIRVMTVHQAKGLEFDAVVLPELDAPLYYQIRSPALPVRREPAGRITAVYPFLKSDLRRLFPEVEQAYAQATAAAVRDGLSNFYVALTRARYATYAIIAADDEKGARPLLTPAYILRQALSRGVVANRVDGDVIHQRGDPQWWESMEGVAEPPATEASVDPSMRAPAPTSPVDGGTPGPAGEPGGTVEPRVSDGDPGLRPRSALAFGEQLDIGLAPSASPAGSRAPSAPPPQLELSFDQPPTPQRSDEEAAGSSAGEAKGTREDPGRPAEGSKEEPTPSSSPPSDAGRSETPRGAIRFANRPRTRRLSRRTPSQLEGGARVDVRYLLRLDTRAAMRRGSVMHAWLERIAWLDDGIPADPELHQVATRIDPALSSSELANLVHEFRRALEQPAIRQTLTRSSYPAPAAAMREVRFLHREADTLLEGSIDRLILVRDQGRVVGAEVIDFKTDLQTGSADVLADRIRYYRPQLAAYCRAVGGMYRLDPSAVKGKLIFLESGHVADVSERDAAREASS